MRRRLILLAAVLVLLGGCLTLTWIALDWPPVGFVLAHGLPSGGGPTGRRFTNDLGMEFIELDSGYYRTGSHPTCTVETGLRRFLAEFGGGEKGEDEHDPTTGACPEEWIEVPRPVWMARTEVTNGQFRRFDPSWKRGVDEALPAVSVSWDRAQEFCRWLWNGEKGRYRLPTEGEWEYAYRAGQPMVVKDVAVKGGKQVRHCYVRDIERYRDRENPWGLVSMVGGVKEWCDGTWSRPTGRGWRPPGFPRSTIREAEPDDPRRKPVRSGAVGTWPRASGDGIRFLAPADRYVRGTGFRVAFVATED